jgi:putative tricarboxylic transport membrane protein
MDQDIDRRADVDVARNGKAGHVPTADTAEQEPADADQKRDIRLTRRVHVVLGLVIAVLGAWLLLRSRAELAFRGPNGEPGPGYLPVLLTLCLVGLGLALSAVWLWGPKARTGEVPTLSLSPRHMARAVLVWLALVVCAFLIEPLGFLLAGEVLVLLVIVVVERIRSIPLIVTLLLLPLAMYLLFDTLLEVQLPGGTLWY